MESHAEIPSNTYTRNSTFWFSYKIDIILGICNGVGESNENWDDISLKFYSLNIWIFIIVSFYLFCLHPSLFCSVLFFQYWHFQQYHSENIILSVIKKEKENRNPFNRATAVFYFRCGGSYGYQAGINTLFIALDTLQTAAEEQVFSCELTIKDLDDVQGEINRPIKEWKTR